MPCPPALCCAARNFLRVDAGRCAFFFPHPDLFPPRFCAFTVPKNHNGNENETPRRQAEDGRCILCEAQRPRRPPRVRASAPITGSGGVPSKGSSSSSKLPKPTNTIAAAVTRSPSVFTTSGLGKGSGERRGDRGLTATATAAAATATMEDSPGGGSTWEG